MRKAFHPSEISELFVSFINSADIEGMLSLFEDEAVIVAGPGPDFARGKIQIREYFASLLSQRPKFDVVVYNKPIINGNIALTSCRVPQAFTTV